MLISRLLTAILVLPIFLGIIYLGGWLYFLLILTICLVGLNEYYTLLEKQKVYPLKFLGFLAAILFLLLSFLWGREFAQGLLYFITSLVVLALINVLIKLDRLPIVEVGATLFGFFYITFLVNFLIIIRSIPELGFGLVFLTLTYAWLTDTGAYFWGKYIGWHKIDAEISPNKSYEGYIPGIILAILIGLFFGLVFEISWYHLLVMGIIGGVLASGGDFISSLIKRQLKTKDWGNLLPGHGGVLDRFASVLLVAPWIYFYAKVILGL
jgi:phosphatidate cytidylyltransferase